MTLRLTSHEHFRHTSPHIDYWLDYKLVGRCRGDESNASRRVVVAFFSQSRMHTQCLKPMWLALFLVVHKVVRH